MDIILNSPDISDTDTIIEGTPVKKKARKLRKIKNKNDLLVKVETRITQHLLVGKETKSFEPDNLFEISKYTLKPYKNLSNEDGQSQKKFIQKQNLPVWKYSGLTKPIHTTVSKNFHNTYIFYEIKEIYSNFSQTKVLKNTCMHLVGTYEYCENSRTHCLLSLEENYGLKLELQLDLREIKLKPYSGSIISMFGSISFVKSNSINYTDVPVLIGKFYQKVIVNNLNAYVELLLRLRTTVPEENFDLVHVPDDASNDETLDSKSDEDGEFLCDINVLKGISLNLEKCGTSRGKDNTFCKENDGLSDSKLCAWLDEFSDSEKCEYYN